MPELFGSGTKKTVPPFQGRRYLVNLQRWRSMAALAACLVTLIAAAVSVTGGMMEFMKNGLPPADLFQYLTTNAGLLAGLAAAFIFPYAVEGIRRKRFTYPKWVALLHYSGTSCTTLIMLFSVTFIGAVDPGLAFGGNNLQLHILCPALVLLCFFLVESGRRYTLRDVFICQIPFWIYALVYLVQVQIRGKERGGWEDLYHVTEYLPWYVSMLLLLLLSMGVTLALRWLYNLLADARGRKLTAEWGDHPEPVEIRIEAYGLGRFAGKNDEENDVHLPMDTLQIMAERCGIKRDELVRAYARGVLDGLAEREMQRSEGKDGENR